MACNKGETYNTAVGFHLAVVPRRTAPNLLILVFTAFRIIHPQYDTAGLAPSTAPVYSFRLAGTRHKSHIRPLIPTRAHFDRDHLYKYKLKIVRFATPNALVLNHSLIKGREYVL